MHWLWDLSQNGHAGAQAFLADLLGRGKYIKPDQARALALISIAVENAPPHERLWIEDNYQNIFCGAGEGTRKQATGIVAEWGNRYGRNPDKRDQRDLLGQLTGSPERTCQNGERAARVPPVRDESDTEIYPDRSGCRGRPRPRMGRLPDRRPCRACAMWGRHSPPTQYASANRRHSGSSWVCCSNVEFDPGRKEGF